MISEHRLWLGIIVAIVTGVVAIVGVSQYFYNERVKAAFSAGLVEGTVEGNSQLVWRKPQ